jgi:hypothetical protein
MDNNVGFNAEAEFENDFSPLQENVVQRDYTRPNVSGMVDSSPIEEAVVIPPTFEDLNNSFQQNLGGAEMEEQPSGDGRKVWGSDDESGSANPYTENLDKKDQKKASEALVEAVLDGYTQLNGFANKLIQFNPNKVQKMISEGEIDGGLRIPIQGQTIGVLDYINEYNKQTEGVISVSDEFKDKVRPVMVRVFQKRNIGMTDEQLLAYYFGVDIIQKGAMVYQLRGQNAQLLAQLKDMSTGYTPPPPQREQAREEAPRQEPQQTNEAPQREYVEPDEVKKESPKEEFVEVEVVKETPKRAKRPTTMPEFGNESILQHMEDIANEGKPRTNTRRKRK